MFEDRIHDVDSYVGHDVAYYLHRGFRVVAIDEWLVFLDRFQPPRRAPAWYDFHASLP